jgi:hypothetical protein
MADNDTETKVDQNGAPEHQQDYLLKFREKFNLNQNPPPAINKSNVPDNAPLKGEVKEIKNPYAYESPLPKVKSAEETENERKESIAIRQKALKLIADFEKQYPTLENLPQYKYDSDYAAGRVQPSTCQKHYDALEKALKGLEAKGKAELKAQEVLATKRADDKVKEIIKEEQADMEDLDDYNNNIGVPEEDYIEIAPQSRALSRQQGTVEEPTDYVTFGQNCYALEHAIVKINLLRQRQEGIDLPSVLPTLEENKEKIEHGYQGLATKYPESFVVKLMNDPIAELLAAHLPVVAAGMEDLQESSKKNLLLK